MKTVEDILNELPGNYKIKISPHLDLDKEFRKDSPLYESIRHLFFRISQDPYSAGKPLRNLLRGKWRVPIKRHSHVMIYRVDRKSQTVTIESYEHHNGAYKPS